MSSPVKESGNGNENGDGVPSDVAATILPILSYLLFFINNLTIITYYILFLPVLLIFSERGVVDARTT